MKLAVIGKVIEVADIPGADRIVQAKVSCGDSGEWAGVVGVDVCEGDFVIVFMPDAILPPHPSWDFMAKHKYRVRMARFKGVPSECVIVSLMSGEHALPPVFEVGMDLTQSIGVTKHTKPIPGQMAGVAKCNFPDYIPKTDEPNFQSCPEIVSKAMAGEWVATLKCDGSSCTAWNDATTGALRVASRNWELEEFDEKGAGNAYWRAARKYDMSEIPQGMALQFEVVGPGIQKNPMGLTEIEGRAFTLYDYGHGIRCGYLALQAVCHAVGIPQAETLFRSDGPRTADELRKMANQTYNYGKPAEGIVIRSMDSAYSFKVLNLDYKG